MSVPPELMHVLKEHQGLSLHVLAWPRFVHIEHQYSFEWGEPGSRPGRGLLVQWLLSCKATKNIRHLCSSAELCQVANELKLDQETFLAGLSAFQSLHTQIVTLVPDLRPDWEAFCIELVKALRSS